jgi:hypothetical protein
MNKARRLSGMASGAALVLFLNGLPERTHGEFVEDFETGTKGSYPAGDVTCTEGSWRLDNFLLGGLVNDQKNGLKAPRGYGSLYMNFDKTNGAGVVTLFHGMYVTDSNNVSGVSWTLSVSRDGGSSCSAYVSPAQAPSAVWRQASLADINVAGSVRIRIDVAGGSSTNRVNFDDIAISDFIAPALTARPASLEPFATRVGTPSAPQSLVIAGENLAADASVTAPAGFEISRHSASNYVATITLPHTNGIVAATTVYVRLKGNAVGVFPGSVVVASEGAAPAYAAVTGTVVANLAPAIAGVPVLTNVTVNQVVQIEMLATDPDGSVAQLCASSATIADANAGLNVQAEGNGLRGVWSWTPSQPGSNTVTFTATDNEGGTADCTLLLLVEREWLIPIRPGQTIREAFDDLEHGLTETAWLPTGWKVEKGNAVRTVGAFDAAVKRTERYGGNNLSSGAANGIYNFGDGDPATAPDRAIGFLSSGNATKSGSLMVRLANRSPEPITGFCLAFDVEKYRAGANANGFAVQVFASTNGLDWSDMGESLRLVFPPDAVTAGYPAAPGEVASATGEPAVAKLPPGQSFYLAWNYSVAAGTTTTYAQALAIDNVVIKALAPPQTLLILR